MQSKKGAIGISNGILPDFGEIRETDSIADEPLLKFSYDNTLEEIDSAMKSFQQTYKSKRGFFMILAYAALTIAVLVAIIMNPTSVLAYAALIFCGTGLVFSLTEKKRARKRTLDALRDMNPEDYTAAFFNDKIEIETVIKAKENEVHVKLDENVDDEIISPLKTTFIIGQDLLEFIENDESLMLIFNRQQIYCFPKRCFSMEQESEVRDFLTNRLRSEN